MKKDKLNIDEFFKEYIDSLPESNFDDEMNQRLKNSIFEKISENQQLKEESKLLKISKNVVRKKYIYSSLAAASLLLAFSIYFIINNLPKNEVKNNISFISSDSSNNQTKVDTFKTKPDVIDSKFDEIQFASLNYDFTSRGSNNDNTESKVKKIIKNELELNNLNYTVEDNQFTSEQFIYKDKLTKLKIKVDDNNQKIIFLLLTNFDNIHDFNLKKINPQIIKNHIESNLLSLIEIE